MEMPGEMYLLLKKKEGIQVCFFLLWLTNDFPYLVGKKMSVFDWGG